MNQIISSEESTDDEEIKRNFDSEATSIIQIETLPKKSANRYVLVYDTYKKWRAEHNSSLSNSEEKNLIVYFKELSQKLKPPTLWCIWSMLKKTLNTQDNIDITKFHSLKGLINNNCKGYKSNKSLVFKWNDIVQFMNGASDYEHLATKVILVFGICGALRCAELTQLEVKDIEDLQNKLLVSVNDTKNDMPRQFVVGKLYYEIVKRYMSLRPNELSTNRFFIQYHKGKCQRQVIGRNKIGEIPQFIASYLNLSNPQLYTGYSFRRTGATLLAGSKDANSHMLQQLGGWKSLTIAQGYVENSLRNRQDIFDCITHENVSDIESNPLLTINNCSIKKISTNNNETFTATNNCANFSDDFEITDEDLTKTDKLDESKVPISATRFTTASMKTILLTHNEQSRRSIHFTIKPPITVFYQGSENEPPQKKRKVARTPTHASEQISECLSNNSSFNKDLCNAYENCVFHGNIINNFYYSCIGCDNKNKKNMQ